MPKLRKPDTSDIFGGSTKYVEVCHMTKGQAKRKLRHAGCGPLQDWGRELCMADTRDMWGRAFLVLGRGWVVHIWKK